MGLHDKVEGGLNTSVLKTPCWDHLFPDKRAQGWEKSTIRHPGDVVGVVKGWQLVLKYMCLCVCARLGR